MGAAAWSLEPAAADLTDDTAASMSVAMAAAHVHAPGAAGLVGGALIKVVGTRSAVDGHSPHRGWGRTRAHAPDGPGRWMLRHTGRCARRVVRRPRQGLLRLLRREPRLPSLDKPHESHLPLMSSGQQPRPSAAVVPFVGFCDRWYGGPLA
jgi:hypothetical protein